MKPNKTKFISAILHNETGPKMISGPNQFKSMPYLALLALVLCVFTIGIRAQFADSFDPNANGRVFVVVVQPDGKVLIGGDFTTLSPNGGAPVTRNYIARLNPDGTLDTAFNPNGSGGQGVFAIALQADGKILVGGFFTSMGGQTRNHIARLDPTTGLADSFDPNASAPTMGVSPVRTIAVQADGKILVGGWFTSIGGQARNKIARLDATTGLADSFDPNPNGCVNGCIVNSIAVQADGKILVGGQFGSIGGQTRTQIARLDAVTGLADSFDPTANTSVSAIAVQTDGKILAIGDFTVIGGQTRKSMARLDAATGLADSWDPNCDGDVYSIVVQSNGKVLAGGRLNNIGGQPRNGIGRLDAITGAADPFDPNAALGTGGIYSIAVQADGKVLVACPTGSIGGQTRNHLARLTNDTAALRDLAVTKTAVTWALGGSGPQFSRVTFESSTDNVNFAALGSGTASGSNWTLSGLSLPTGQNIYVRARGYYRNSFLSSSESILETVRNAFISSATSISGTVTYGNAIPAAARFVSNALISGAGSPNVSALTSAPGGQYSLSGFEAGSYTVTPSRSGGVNGAITSFDAAKIAQHVSGINLLAGNQLIVADVSGNGSITSFDAAQIAQFVAGTGSGMQTGTWRFSPVNRMYAAVTADIAGEDYSALLMGEVSGNWSNTGGRPAGSRQLAVGSEPERDTAVTVPHLVTPADGEVLIPVNIEGVADKGIISYEFDLKYDPAVIQPQADPVDISGTFSDKLSVVVNAKQAGLLRVVVYGAMPIDGNGVLLNLKFNAVGAPSSVTPLTWERIMFNEGDPQTVATDGQVDVSAAAQSEAEISNAY